MSTVNVWVAPSLLVETEVLVTSGVPSATSAAGSENVCGVCADAIGAASRVAATAAATAAASTSARHGRRPACEEKIVQFIVSAPWGSRVGGRRRAAHRVRSPAGDLERERPFDRD